LEGNGPGDVAIIGWDPRNTSTPKFQYVESHNDTVTELQFHPTTPHLLLSGATDNLLNVFSTQIADEDDAVVQVVNHRAAIHCAGYHDGDTIYSLGTDETLAYYKQQLDPETEEDPVILNMGDVREKYPGEYMVGMTWADKQPLLAFGSHSAGHLDLIESFNPPLESASVYHDSYMEILKTKPRFRLPDAHHGEVVRDVFVDAANDVGLSN